MTGAKALSPLSLAGVALLPLLTANNYAISATGEGNGGTLNAVSHDGENGELPPYDFQIHDGLYSTVTALRSFEEPKLPAEATLRLKNITGFKKDLKVRVLWQKKPAPLVVLLLGLATKSKAPLAQLWKANMHHAGCHVLTFDSVFLPSFNERAGHGVAGNVEVEAQIVGNVIATFLKHKKTKGRVTKLGIVGGSYGGTVSLHLSRLVKSGKMDIPLEAVLAFSPPVCMESSAKLLDKYHAEDRWRYTLMELGGDLLGHEPVKPGKPIPFTQSEMRAGIAAAFRLDLTHVIDRNDRHYDLKKLPKADMDDEDDQYRKDVAETWTFTRFMEEMSFPYWQKKGVANTPKELWALGRLEDILPECPDYVHVIITADDPLNEIDETDVLQSNAPEGMLTVLPNGGHLGYVHTKWAKARMKQLFND